MLLYSSLPVVRGALRLARPEKCTATTLHSTIRGGDAGGKGCVVIDEPDI